MRLVDYSGFDLCAKNIENARALYRGVSFAVGNVFEIAAADKAFDLCFVHDLFEHLSLEGMHAAVKEVCRVTRQGLCISFFNMDEIRDHQMRPVDEYHWNLLSMARMRDSSPAAALRRRSCTSALSCASKSTATKPTTRTPTPLSCARLRSSESRL